MLGLGSNMMKHPVTGKSIVRDGLVLQHNYNLSSVEPLSSGAADINADAAANEHIDVGVIPITTNDVSISVWVYITTWVNYAGIVVNRSSSGTNPGLGLRCANGAQKLQLVIDDANGSSSEAISSTLNSNQWYHVCGVWDRSGNMSLYIDGVLDGTDDITGNPLTLTHSTATKIGQANTTEMRGYVCNVGYWNAALSQAQVKSIMNKNYDSLSASEKTDLVSWWNLDSVIPDTTTLVYDNHHGGEGEVLGSEMVQNGSFDNGTTNWTKPGTTSATQEIIDGALKMYSGTADDNSNLLSKTSGYNMGGVSGKMYRLKLTSSNYSSGNGKIRLDAVYLAGAAGSISFAAGTKYVYFVAYRDFSFIQFIGSSHSTHYTIDDVSLKLVNGNTGTLS